MPKKNKPQDSKADPIRGFPSRAYVRKKVKFRDGWKLLLNRCGFSQEDINHSEWLAGRYQAELRNPTKLDDAREGHNQLLAGLEIQDGNEDTFLIWLRGLNLTARIRLGRYMGDKGDEIIEILRDGQGPDDLPPISSYIQILQEAIPKAAKFRLPQGHPPNEPRRALVEGLVRLWYKVKNEWPKRKTVVRNLPNQSDSDKVERHLHRGPFYALVRAAAGHGYVKNKGFDSIIRSVIADCRKFEDERQSVIKKGKEKERREKSTQHSG